MKKMILAFTLFTLSAFAQSTTTQVIQTGGDACRALQGLTQTPCLDNAMVFIFSTNPRAEGFKVELKYDLLGATSQVVESRVLPALQIPNSPTFVSLVILDRARNVSATAKTLISE